MQQQNFSGVVRSDLIDRKTLRDAEVKPTDGVFVYMDFIRDLYRIVSGSLTLSFDGIVFLSSSRSRQDYFFENFRIVSGDHACNHTALGMTEQEDVTGMFQRFGIIENYFCVCNLI